MPKKCLPASKEVQPVAPEIVEKTLPHMPQVVADMVKIQQLAGLTTRADKSIWPTQTKQVVSTGFLCRKLLFQFHNISRIFFHIRQI